MPKVLYEKRGRIAYVTINRPEARNAIDPDVHRLMIETWADFRDDDAVDVAILTGAGEAFCAGADLKTYIPPIMEERQAGRHPRDRRARPGRVHPRHAPDLQADHRRGQRLGAGRRPRDSAGLRHPHRLRASDVRLLRGPARLPSRRRRAGPPPQRLRNRRRLSHAPHRRAGGRPAGTRLGPGRRVVPHERLLEEAETVAGQILRNSQRAVRSAKQTILDTIGRPLDEQLRNEAWNAYTCADPDETLELLGRFYEKTDAGRAGEHHTDL